MFIDLDSIKEQYLPKLEQEFIRFHSRASSETGSAIAEMSQYQLETGGKRLRALIPLFMYQSLGLDPVSILHFGTAVEMIHNATLVHDDLQDGDELRRGRPTIWKRYSSAQAINCGDAMFQYALQLILEMKLESSAKERLLKRAINATLHVIEGQAQEFLMKDELYPSFQRYLEVIRGKTSGLFVLPVVGALEAAGIDQKICDLVENAALDLGILFQIQDDVLDIYGEKGRGFRGSDVAEGKISALVAYVNASGSSNDKSDLLKILKKPRENTTPEDIAQAIGIFERNHCKENAMAYIREIRKKVNSHEELSRQAPHIYKALVTLGQTFLAPIAAIF